MYFAYIYSKICVIEKRPVVQRMVGQVLETKNLMQKCNKMVFLSVIGSNPI